MEKDQLKDMIERSKAGQKKFAEALAKETERAKMQKVI